MSEVSLRLPLGLGHRLREIVSAEGEHEAVASCLVSHVEVCGSVVMLVRHVLAFAEEDYLHGGPHGAAWRGTAMLPAIELAMREGLGIVLVHAHDVAGQARLSRDDMSSAGRLVPMFQARVPGRPHGSIVLGRGTAAGVVALPGRAPALMKDLPVRWLGKSILHWPNELNDADGGPDVFDRQALVVGQQTMLTTARVAVVGLCGGGSHVVQQLAHAGVGTIVGIDGDVCDPTNLHRDVGMRPRDGQLGSRKTDVMARLVRAIGTGSRFVGVNALVPEPAALEALAGVDVIVGCVDNLHARADLQEIALRHLIPYVDVGVSVRALDGPPEAPRATIGGNVFVFIPGGFCAWCCGFVTEDKLRAERGGRDDRSYFQNRTGQAQVISFNAVVAGQAVSEVIQLLTAFRGSSIDPAALRTEDGQQRGALKMDGLRGTLQEWGAVRRVGCPSCTRALAAGKVLWTTPAESMSQSAAVTCLAVLGPPVAS
jgi:hypothetical protein